MAPRQINGIDELKALAGEHLGYSDYLEITQERVNTFAEATGDHQWIHVDVERAKQGPFGGPIAHGYLTLSLGPTLAPQIFSVEGISMGVNYGSSKVRFPSRSAPTCDSAPSSSASTTSPEASRSRWSSSSRSRVQRSRRASPR